MIDLIKLANAAIAARELASDCLPIEYHDYSNKAHDAHMAFINKIQPDDYLAVTAALFTVRKNVLKIVEEMIKDKFPPSVPSDAVDGVNIDGQMYPSADILAYINALKLE